jgi:hypothetical protein
MEQGQRHIILGSLASRAARASSRQVLRWLEGDEQVGRTKHGSARAAALVCSAGARGPTRAGAAAEPTLRAGPSLRSCAGCWCRGTCPWWWSRGRGARCGAAGC